MPNFLQNTSGQTRCCFEVTSGDYGDAGLVGADGPTHAGSFDITYLSTLPNFVVMAASDESELVKMINTSVNINDRPSAFRYPRGNGIGIELPSINEILEIGKGRVIKEGKKVALINFGTRLAECKKASEKLLKKGIDCTIIDARFAKPLDEKMIIEVASNHEVLITIEEGSIGGFGSHVMQFLSDRGVFDKGLKFRSMILPDILLIKIPQRKCMKQQVWIVLQLLIKLRRHLIQI